MKRKIFSILFAVVLVASFSQVTQVIPTALASAELLPEVEFQVGENSSAEWTTQREYAGTYSVLLSTLYPTPLSHYARVATPYGDTLDSISSISYWEYYVKDWPESVTELWGVYVSIELDTGTYNYPGGTLIDPAFDGVADHWLMGDPHLQDGWSTPSTWPQIWNDWVQRTFDDDAYFWSPIDGNESETTHQLSSWKEGTTGVDTTISATSIVLKTKFAIGEGIAGEGWPQDHYKKVYFDDLEINGTTYELEPRVVNSDTTQGFNTIQDAIDAAGTGDTITVAAGTYTENVELNKQLTLTGDLTQPGNVVVDAGGSGSAITLTVDGCVLQGFKVQNGEYGIYVYGSNSNTLSSNCVTGNNVGVKIEGADASTMSIRFNEIRSNTQYGLENSGSGIADATNNWWGDNSGPSHTGNPDGTGDAVSDNVNYDPWHLKQIGDLTATNATESSIDLSWTTIGAWDGDYFDVRYSTSPITLGNWNSASQVTGEPTPSTSTASQGMKVNGLSSGTTYYFGLKLIDADIGSSDISNIASATTLVYIPPIPITYQPDNQIKNQGEETYIGDGTYNTDGTNQAKSQIVDNNVTATYEIKVENDSNSKDALNVSGTAGGAGWTVTYYSLTEGTDITAHVTAGIWFTRVLAPGASEEIRVEVTPDGTVPGGSSKEVLVTSTSAYGDATLDAVKAITMVTATYQPDNQIKNQGEATYIGDGTYNADSTNQAKSQIVDNSVTATYEIKVENDGNTSDTFTVTGTAGSDGWTITYYSLTEGTDITSDVIEDGWSTGALASGASKEIRLEVTPDSTLAGGSSKEVLVTSTSAFGGTTLDVVKATTWVIFIPGDANGDGAVDTWDITKVERIIAGLDAETPGADANQDGSINALDITKVERIITGLD